MILDNQERSNDKIFSRANVWAVLMFMVVAGITRALPHPPNFTPLAAMALFGGAYLTNRKMAFILPLVAMMFSDLFLEALYQVGLREYSGIHTTMLFVYASFMAITFLGTLISTKLKPVTLLGASLLSSVLFFVVTNFGVYVSGLWGTDATGLVTTYTMALPFFSYTVLGDLFFVSILFGGFEVLKQRLPDVSLVRTRK